MIILDRIGRAARKIARSATTARDSEGVGSGLQEKALRRSVITGLPFVATGLLVGSSAHAQTNYVSQGPVIATGGTTARFLADRFADVINVRDHGIEGNGIAIDPTKITALLAYLESTSGTALDAQYPPTTAKVLYFPSGHYKATSFTEILSWGTGATIVGDGLSTRLENFGIHIEDDACSVGGMMLMGVGTYGMKVSRSGRRGSFLSDLYIRDLDVGYICDGGGDDTMVNVIIDRCGTGMQFLANDIEQCYTNVIVRLCIEDNIQIAPTSSVSALKFTNCTSNGAGRYGLHLKAAASPIIIVECYFIGLTSSQSAARSVSITGVTDLGGGLVRVATPAPHLLLPGVADAVISGTTDYNGTHVIVATSDTTHFDIAETYTSSQSGSMSTDGWDIFCDLGGSTANRINDIFFIGGNANHVHLSGYNLQFKKMRLKEEIWLENVSNCEFDRIFRGRAGAGVANVPIGGTGAATGWAEIGYDTGELIDSVDYSPGSGSMVMRAPYAAGGLSGLMPALYNSISVGETGVTIERQGATVPKIFHAGGVGAIIANTGVDAAVTILDYYTIEVYVPETTTLTGISILNGTVVAGNAACCLYNIAGTPIAAAQTAVTAVVGAGVYQKIPFATPYKAPGPCRYFIVIQYSDATNRARVVTTGNFLTDKIGSAAAMGTFNSLTPPTGFVSNRGPISDLY